MKKRKDGRYQKAIKDPKTEKIIYFYGNTEKEVYRKMIEYSEKSEQNERFDSIADEWWGDALEQIAPTTARSYRIAKQRAIEQFGNQPVKNITPKQITIFLQSFAKKGYSQKTILNQKLVLNLIFTRAILNGYITSNPTQYATIPRGKPKTPRTSAAGNEEETIKTSAHIWLFPYMALMTGMRKGELIALQWQDIDFEKNLIYVSKASYYQGTQAIIKEPKTKAGIRTIPLLKPLREQLLRQNEKTPSKYILGGEKPLSSTQFRTRMNAFKKKTGITCTMHQLRHSFATIAFECGVPIKSIQEILGHANYATTMDIYTDFRKSALDDATEKLNSALK